MDSLNPRRIGIEVPKIVDANVFVTLLCVNLCCSMLWGLKPYCSYVRKLSDKTNCELEIVDCEVSCFLK